MSPINYLLSGKFAYEKTIHADAGPGYAQRQQWTSAVLSRLRDMVPHEPTLIDNRVTDEEMAEISRLLPALSRHPVYVKVVDPYWEQIKHPYYRWLLSLTKLPNVCFIGPYQATGLTALLRDMSRPDAYVHLPYAYESDKEQPLAHADRTKFLAFSGAVHPDYYPERSAMVRAMRRHWWAARNVNVLPHPGYPDVGQIALHAVTGDRYLDFLARHRFMYLEPSRDRLEFLKYSECAYAGCVPVGRVPSEFPPELSELVLPLEAGNLRQDLRRLATLEPAACSDAARLYRERLKRARDPQRLNAHLFTHWQRQVERLGSTA